MSRKTDDERLNELQESIEEDKKKIKDLSGSVDDDKEEEEEDSISQSNKGEEKQPQIVEREINLSLINDKLNFIISVLQTKK